MVLGGLIQQCRRTLGAPVGELRRLRVLLVSLLVGQAQQMRKKLFRQHLFDRGPLNRFVPPLFRLTKLSFLSVFPTVQHTVERSNHSLETE